MIRLSHSAKDKLNFCGALYRNHYIDRVRSLELGSPLFFGSALDDAFGCLLLEKKKELTEEEKTQVKKGPLTLFLEGMQTTNFNGEDLDISMYQHCSYFKSDYDSRFLDIITEKVTERFGEYDLEPFMEHALSRNVKLNEEETAVKNYVCWLSLIEKGKLMIDAYKEEVLPQIEEVIAVQKKIELPNDNGDVIVGYIDFIGTFVDEPGEVYIIDNKTSSRAYKKDSVQTSEQLATYCEHEGVTKAAYIVVEKNLRKRIPVKITIIKDTIPEKQFDETLDLYAESLYNITEGNFEKNYDSGCFLFGRKCQYYDYCRSDGQITKGLVKLPERKE